MKLYFLFLAVAFVFWCFGYWMGTTDTIEYYKHMNDLMRKLREDLVALEAEER